MKPCLTRWLKSSRGCRFICLIPSLLIGTLLTHAFIGTLFVIQNIGSVDDDDVGPELGEQYGHKFSIKDKEQECSISEADSIEYPNCREKLNWMEGGWQTHGCYARYGVNGTFCSFRVYLSEVEKHCPVLPLRKAALFENVFLPQNKRALVQRNLSGIFELMYDNEVNYSFIRDRITRLWPKWLDAYDEMAAMWPETVRSRPKLNIMMHMGFLGSETGFKFGELSSVGGPLGELVQWSDLIAALYLLGHNLIISTEISTLRKNIKKFDYESPCPVQNQNTINLFFTDIIGVRYLRGKMSDFFLRVKCSLRVLDSFGTHMEFNIRSYFAAHKKDLGGAAKNPWGGHQLNLQQFMTMFPHTDDNTFLGFVVEMHSVDEDVERDNATLVYGKERYMWNGSRPLLEIVRKFTEVHATVGTDLSDFHELVTKNHGVLSTPKLHSLMRRVKIFLGLGFPLEGPAPLEAVASGAVFINPSFSPPKSRKTYDFFQEKPTLRELTSQNPYAEVFIGKPHVITVDIENLAQLESAIREALLTKPSPFLPFEFTVLGMLQRVNILISKQDFCYISKFPPLEAMRTVEAGSKQSCQDACRQRDLLCEHSFFRFVNIPAFVNRSKTCTKVTSTSSPHAPYACSRQENPNLYSCASVPTDPNIRRICPCRDFLRGQTALCSSCI